MCDEDRQTRCRMSGERKNVNNFKLEKKNVPVELGDEILKKVSAGSGAEDSNDEAVTHVSKLQDQVRVYGDDLRTDAQKMTEKMEAYMAEVNK